MTQANCSTCFDLDFRYIPQPHKNRRIRSIGQPARHWISSAMLAETTSCESCKLLKSSFDALTSSWGISATEGRSIPYQIAIIEPDDAGAGDASEQEGGGAISKAPRSLKVIMRCNPEYTKDGEKGGFDEEFEVEIYTPINSKTHIFWGVNILKLRCTYRSAIKVEGHRCRWRSADKSERRGMCEHR